MNTSTTNRMNKNICVVLSDRSNMLAAGNIYIERKSRGGYNLKADIMVSRLIMYHFAAMLVAPACTWMVSAVGSHVGNYIIGRVWKAAKNIYCTSKQITVQTGKIYMVLGGEAVELNPAAIYTFKDGQIVEILEVAPPLPSVVAPPLGLAAAIVGEDYGLARPAT
jgi:hypothetical protein